MTDRLEGHQSNFEDYYAVLGVEPNAEVPAIRKAYIVKAKLQHPDAGGSEQVMRQLNKAYKTLIDPNSKAAYDMLHSYHTGSTKPADYRYSDGRQVNDITDMTDDEIDSFLDNLLFDEYKDGVQKPKTSVRDKMKNYFKRADSSQ